MANTTTGVSPLSSRPPIVAVLGHVDHGKTTLLDVIRKTHVAQGEHGGITQAIGAYQIEVKSEKPRYITFIDNPGHEAFANMRGRGAKVADIAILVVAADDSVKPQTIESIRQITSAGIAMIVAINKIDLPAANVERVKSDLAKHGVQVEGFGGDVPFALISAKLATGIDQLLDLIMLVWDMKGLPVDPQAYSSAVVIETRLDKGKGMVATLIVKSGEFTNGMMLYDDRGLPVAKIRAMNDESGVRVANAAPSRPVEVSGLTRLPSVGSVVTDSGGVSGKHAAAPVSDGSANHPIASVPSTLPDFLQPIDHEAQRIIRIILKADTAGSLEAVMASLPKKVLVVQQGIGDITEADVLAAKTTRTIIIGFWVSIRPGVVKLAETEKVVYRIYRIIYELLDELGEVVAGLKEVLREERELGKGAIIAQFPFEKDRIAGTKVASGRIARGDSVKIMRGEEEIARAKVKSLRHGKDTITRADAGVECGILFDQKLDFTIGDAIIAFTQ